MTRSLYRRAAFILGCWLLGPLAAAEQAALTVGVVPQFDAREIHRVWAPILAAVSERSGVALTLVPSPDIPAFEKAFEHGEYDLAYMNPYHAVIAKEKAGYQPILHDVSEPLYGIIVVRRDSPLEDIKQLDGLTVAMPAPNALGAALLPRAEFAKLHNIEPDIRYVRSHTSAYLNVVLRQADAAGGVQATLDKQPAQVRDQLRVLYRTQGVPSHPIVAHPRVSAEQRRRITAAFLALGDTESGRQLLAPIPIARIGKTDFGAFEPLVKLGLKDFYVKKK